MLFRSLQRRTCTIRTIIEYRDSPHNMQPLLGGSFAPLPPREKAAGQTKHHELQLAAQSRRVPRATRGLSLSQCPRCCALYWQSIEFAPPYRFLLSPTPPTATQATPHDRPCPGGDNA